MRWSHETRKYWTRLQPWLVPHPNSGKLWVDTLYILLIVAVQTVILPVFLNDWVAVDLLTPWLMFILVNQPTSKVIALGAVAALSLETHISVPSGLYLCAYLIFGTLVLSIRHNISWRKPISWLVMFIAFELWVIVLENLFTVIRIQTWSFLDSPYLFANILRLALAGAFGMALLHKYALIQGEEKRA